MARHALFGHFGGILYSVCPLDIDVISIVGTVLDWLTMVKFFVNFKVGTRHVPSHTEFLCKPATVTSPSSAHESMRFTGMWPLPCTNKILRAIGQSLGGREDQGL